jgi:hypothetical protein
MPRGRSIICSDGFGQTHLLFAPRSAHIAAFSRNDASLSVKEPKAVYGLKPFARRGGIVTNELIDKLRDEDAY